MVLTIRAIAKKTLERQQQQIEIFFSLFGTAVKLIENGLV